jgi:hypothetical protein
MNINDHPQNFRFTRENARENAAKSWQANRRAQSQSPSLQHHKRRRPDNTKQR